MATTKTAASSELKNKLMNQQPTTAADPAKRIHGLLQSMGGELQKALPKHLNADRMARIALTTIRQNPKLLECQTASLLGAVMQAAQLGLEPSLLGHCYLVPFKDNKNGGVMNVQFIIGYKGYIELMRRSGDVTSIVANEVCENDEFILEYGIEEKLSHKPALEDRGEVTCYYAYARFKEGGHAFTVMSKKEIERIRDKYSKAKEFGPWKEEFDSMAKKTVIRQLAKYMPLSVEIAENLSTDHTYRKDLLDENHQVDYETGEIIDMIPVSDEQPAEQPAG